MPWLKILSLETPDGKVIQVEGLAPEEPYPIPLLSIEHRGHTYAMRFVVATTPEGKFPVAFTHADGETKIFDADPLTVSPLRLAQWFHGKGCPPEVLLELLESSMAECSPRAQQEYKDFLRRN